MKSINPKRIHKANNCYDICNVQTYLMLSRTYSTCFSETLELLCTQLHVGLIGPYATFSFSSKVFF